MQDIEGDHSIGNYVWDNMGGVGAVDGAKARVGCAVVQ